MEFYIQHGAGTAGPFRTESAPARVSWKPGKSRAGVIRCRFQVRYAGRWRRLYSDTRATGIPHFIIVDGGRLAITGVCP